MEQPLWTPSETHVSASLLTAFTQYVEQAHQITLSSYNDLHQWSITNSSKFWRAVWKQCGIIGDVTTSSQQEQPRLNFFKTALPDWLNHTTLNYAENCLQWNNDNPALIYHNETGYQRTLTHRELKQQVMALAQYLKTLGVKSGDRIAGFLPNQPETIIAMLASTAIGAIWSSCSPDFGLEGLQDRFGQIQPKVLFAINEHQYQGKRHQHKNTINTLRKTLEPHLQEIIWIDYNEATDFATSSPSKIFSFEQLPFDHPAFILYSSGTTGKPKCMVHSTGGTLLQHVKEHQLHTNILPEDRLFFFTTCGWMMWNWLASGLASGATLVLYDGSPFHPNNNTLFDLIDSTKITHFGVGAKFLELSEKKGMEPKKTHPLTSLKTILTTGSPLLPESFDYVYKHIKNDFQLSSISGGSDIISCFALGNPNLPVYRGELQCLGLGMDVAVLNKVGEVLEDKKGELVCRNPFPSMPLYFWNDPEGIKYKSAYFKTYPNTWAHGDFAKLTENGGMIIYGRSDTTLNPGGIRIGTAEIYQQLEKFPEISDAIAVENQEKIILFVVIQNKTVLDERLIKNIQKTIRENTSPHHVPSKIIAAPDLPRTISGKNAELAVKHILDGKPIKNTTALANPECLDFFKTIKFIGSKK